MLRNWQKSQGMYQFIFYLFVPMEYVAYTEWVLWPVLTKVQLTFNNWLINHRERENTGDFRDPSAFLLHSHLVQRRYEQRVHSYISDSFRRGFTAVNISGQKKDGKLAIFLRHLVRCKTCAPTSLTELNIMRPKTNIKISASNY